MRRINGKYMKVGIVTINGNENYGNVLQNYAVQEVLKEVGAEAETILNRTQYGHCTDSGEKINKLTPSYIKKYVTSQLNYKYNIKNSNQGLLKVKGLHTYLNKEYDNLITQDIICHGVPSPLVWEKYIDKYSELQEVKFRDKRFGWHYFSMYIKSKKGTYRKRLDEDFYERLFLDNTTLRPICYDCPVKRSGSGADITLADCWGSDKLCKEIQDTDRGLSLVLIHTKQGKYLWKKLIENQCIRTERLAAEKALSSQSALIESAPCNPRRKVFFESLQKSGFAKLEKSWYGDSVIRRIKRKEIYYVSA